MKTNFNSHIRTFALILLFGAPIFNSSSCHAYNEDKIYELVEQFLDLKQPKTFVQFVTQFNQASQGRPELNDLRNQLAAMKNSPTNNPMALAQLIKKHEGKFSPRFKTLIASKGMQVLTILKARLAAK
jgi:hypothetical protein